MNISDIITLLSLVIAIIAIINENNRRHLLFKFYYFDYLLIAVSFLLINYFVFYEGFYTRGLYLNFLYFDQYGLENPKNWSYLISLATLGFLFYKIWFSFYSYFRMPKVFDFYNQLIKDSSIDFLIDLIKRYHLRDISRFLSDTKHQEKITLSTNMTFELNYHKKRSRFSVWFYDFKKAFTPRLKRYDYAKGVLWGIYNHPIFISSVVKHSPYLFVGAIERFKKSNRGSYPNDLSKKFYRELLEIKSHWLIKELKECENSDYGQGDYFFENNKIIGGLLKNLEGAEVSQVWYAFGEGGIDEIEEEKEKGINSHLLREYKNDSDLWAFKTFMSITFFKHLIIEAITRDYKGCHFWLYYFRNFTTRLLSILEDANAHSFNYITVASKMIEQMLGVLRQWIALANESEASELYHDIIDCYSDVMINIIESSAYSEKYKIDMLEGTLNLYCSLLTKAKTKSIREKLEEILLAPRNVDSRSHDFYSILNKAWGQLDKIPHQNYTGNTDLDYFDRLKRRVVIPLSLG